MRGVKRTITSQCREISTGICSMVSQERGLMSRRLRFSDLSVLTAPGRFAVELCPIDWAADRLDVIWTMNQ